MEFENINLDDFTSFKIGHKPSYVLIEESLIDIGGQGIKGNEFKKKCLNEAGWKYGKLISYGSHPETACQVFVTIKAILEKTQEKDEIISLLSKKAS